MGIWLLIAVVFVGGFGWGQWWAERRIRAEQAVLVKDRVTVSMPMDPEDAAATLGLLEQLVLKVQRERNAKP